MHDLFLKSLTRVQSDVDTFVWFPLMKVGNKYDNTFYFIT